MGTMGRQSLSDVALHLTIDTHNRRKGTPPHLREVQVQVGQGLHRREVASFDLGRVSEIGVGKIQESRKSEGEGGVLRGTTKYYEVLRGITRYYEVTTRYYEVLRGTTRY